MTANYSVIFCFRLAGTIPGPIIFGALIDQACILSSGSCLLYDNRSMAIYMMVTSVSAKLLGVVCFIAALYTSLHSKVKDTSVSS